MLFAGSSPNPQPDSPSPFATFSGREQSSDLPFNNTSNPQTPAVGTTVCDPSFSVEQKRYLEGFFAGARQRLTLAAETPATLAAHSAHSNTQPTLFHGTPVEELTREELWKYERNPLDAWDELLAHTNESKTPNAEDTYRFKTFGLFYVAPAQDSFMLRMRVPGGVLTAHQMRGLARMAEDFGNGRTDLTTRANLQIRALQPHSLVPVLKCIAALGMSSRGSGADNVRNITASPLTGLDPLALLDVRPQVEALADYIGHSRDLFGLPRKFNVAFDDGGTVSTLADTNDIGFQAVQVAEGRSLPAGVYFRVLLCGITGHRQFATDAGILIRPQEAVAVAAAMIRVFAANGNRTDRKKARLKYLIDRWGIDEFLRHVEGLLAFPLLHFPAQECDARAPIDRAGHIGVHPQAQPGLSYIGVVVPVGRLPVDQMRTVADIAEQFGSGEIRLTVWQNLIVPNIPDKALLAAREALLMAGLSFTAGTVLSGTVACTGNQGCKFAQTDTKTHAVALANHLDARFTLTQPVNLHVTGCPHSCAQHYIGDIGLMGVKVSGAEGYQINLGGGADGDQGIGRELIAAAPVGDVPALLEGLFTAFESYRSHDDETLLSFTQRHSIEQLRDFAEAKTI